MMGIPIRDHSPQPIRLSDVGNDVWVGNNAACNHHGHEFDRIVHVWLPIHLDSGLVCRCIKSGESRGIAVQWQETDSVGKLSVPLATLMDYSAPPGRILYHCVAGHCRSPTLAVAAKVARGCPVFRAITEVTADLWRDSGLFAQFHYQTFDSLLPELARMRYEVPPKGVERLPQ